MSIEIKSDILAKELNQGIVPLGVPKAYQYDAALVEAARAAVNQGLDDVTEAEDTAVNSVKAQESTSTTNINILGDKILAQMKHGYGYPFTAASAAAMTDTTKIYVYTGSETGYTAGNWYYYNGSAWVSGGVYNATALETDKTLTVSGAAADALVTGEFVKSANVNWNTIQPKSISNGIIGYAIQSSGVWATANGYGMTTPIAVNDGDVVNVKWNVSSGVYYTFGFLSTNTLNHEDNTNIISGGSLASPLGTNGTAMITIPSGVNYFSVTYSITDGLPIIKVLPRGFNNSYYIDASSGFSYKTKEAMLAAGIDNLGALVANDDLHNNQRSCLQIKVSPGQKVYFSEPVYSVIFYSSETPSSETCIGATVETGVQDVDMVEIPNNCALIIANVVPDYISNTNLGYRIINTIKNDNNSPHWILGGMDNGIPNRDKTAAHSVEYFKVTSLGHIGIYSNCGKVLQCFDSDKNYLRFKLISSSGYARFLVEDDVKFVKLCVFDTQNTIFNLSEEGLAAYNIMYSGIEIEKEKNIQRVVKTKAFKASPVSASGTVLFSDQGEGTIDQIQLIGAYDTTGASKNAFWPNYYRNVLTVTVDGVVAVQGTIYDLCGLSSSVISDEEYANGIFENAVFDTPLFAKTGLYSGITFKFKIPYYKSVEVKVSGTNGTMWGLVKALNYVDIDVNGFKIPYGARFHGVTVSKNCVKGDLIEIFNTSNPGLLVGVNVAGTSSAFDWVEGCIRALPYGLTSQNNAIMLSSGLEDYLGGAFGYNVGEKQFTNWGCTLKRMTSEGGYRLVGYRNHFGDHVPFEEGGFKLTGRWGDQNANNWDLSDTSNFAGQTGNPGVGTFVATGFYYEWDAD